MNKTPFECYKLLVHSLDAFDGMLELLVRNMPFLVITAMMTEPCTRFHLLFLQPGRVSTNPRLHNMSVFQLDFRGMMMAFHFSVLRLLMRTLALLAEDLLKGAFDFPRVTPENPATNDTPNDTPELAFSFVFLLVERCAGGLKFANGCAQ